MTWLAVANILRALSIPLAALTAGISVRVAVDHRYRSTSQMRRFIGLAVICLSVAFGEFHALGHQPYWPALVGLMIGLAYSLSGTLPLAWSGMRSASLRDTDDPPPSKG